MRDEYVNYSFWLLIIGSWVFGFAYGKWLGGSSGVFADVGQAVSVPPPADLIWWHPLLYFPLTVLAAFILSQLFFGAGSSVFMFARGVGDSAILLNLEAILKNLNVLNINNAQAWNIFFIMLVFTVNLPLCIWASHLGTSRSARMFQRLRGKPLQPESGIISGMLILLGVSLVIGFFGTIALSYAA